MFKSIKDEDELYEALIDLAFNFLEECMKVVLSYMRETYNIETDLLEEEELEKLFYSKDGKTMQERIKEYITKEQLEFTYCIYRFLRTEAVVTTNKILFTKLKDHFDFVMVENAYCCELCMDTVVQLSSWTPIEKVDPWDLPPYHPDCCCVLKFASKEDIK